MCVCVCVCVRERERERERERGSEPDEISRGIFEDEAGGAVVDGRRSEGSGGDVGGGRRDGEVDPANDVASDDGDFLAGERGATSHLS